jgi:hypothetical protein
MDSMRPPVFRPKVVPRSYTRLNSTYLHDTAQHSTSWHTVAHHSPSITRHAAQQIGFVEGSNKREASAAER